MGAWPQLVLEGNACTRVTGGSPKADSAKNSWKSRAVNFFSGETDGEGN